ncbi:MAG TPA: rod shape-determining protein RodA [Candidatus Limnocylindrales bacterium]|jgi:rod shape determining protein RodA|nr:rod shape-determining protein RodA [Candidatus Limnocylindrales bacterium]
MGVLKAEPFRVSHWASRSIVLIWRAFDLQLTLYALLLAIVGLVMAYTNSVAEFGSALAPGSTFTRGLAWMAVAIVAYGVATAIDYRWLKTLGWPIYVGTLALLVLTLLVGDGVGGTARWVAVGPIVFQFSELAKIGMIVVLARYLSAHRDRIQTLPGIVGACVLVGPPVVLVMLQPDLGTSLVFLAILAGMLFTGGAPLRWLGLLAGTGLAAFPFVWTHLLRDYQRERLLAFLDPAADIQGSGYQLYQSQIAVGSGGMFGKGLTNGTQNQLDFLPVQTTDFVFAILAEELGFIGGIVVFALFALLLWRILACAWRSRDPFGLLVATGLASMILFQLFVNVGMVIGIMPITGIPLPFVTHGGASLTSLAIGLGLLQSVNIRQVRAEW